MSLEILLKKISNYFKFGFVNDATKANVQIRLGNFADYLNGFQFGIGNEAGELNGLQVGAVNAADYSRGVQHKTDNDAKKSNGVQFGGVSAADYLNGWQASVLSFAGNLNGFQSGGFNFCFEKLIGLQAGLVCYAEEGNYLQLGGITIRNSGPWYTRITPFIGFHKEKNNQNF